MEKQEIYYLGALGLAVAVVAGFFLARQTSSSEDAVRLEVPYAAQAPAGAWEAPWNEACEEASAIMVEAYYEGRSRLPAAEVEEKIRELVAWQEGELNNYQDTNAEETAALIEEHFSFEARIRRSPSLGEIKAELDARRPVIALVNMYKLYGEADQGDSFHVLVITGYEDERGLFFVSDPARAEAGEYPFAVLMAALHDYNRESGEADGEETVIFTRPRDSWLIPAIGP